MANAPASCIQLYGLPPGTVNFPDGTGALTDEACKAKQYLLQHQDCTTGQGITGLPPQDCIRRLDNDFAIKLANAMQNEPQLAGTNVHSGYRTQQGEGLIGNGASGYGNHTKGCAADLTGGTWSKSSCGVACQHVTQQSARLGLKLSFRGQRDRSGALSEENHIEPTAACNGNPGGLQPPPGPGTFQSGPFGQQPPNLFGQQPPGGMFGQPTGFPQQTMPASQNPYSYISPTPSTGVNTIVTNAEGTNPSQTNTGSPSPSAIEQINRIANPTTTPAVPPTASSTGSPIALITGIKDVGSIQSSQQMTPNATTSVQIPVAVNQTFISEDMRMRPAVQGKMLGSTNLYMLLENLKQVLLNILNFLRPFGKNSRVELQQEVFTENGH